MRLLVIIVDQRALGRLRKVATCTVRILYGVSQDVISDESSTFCRIDEVGWQLRFVGAGLGQQQEYTVEVVGR